MTDLRIENPATAADFAARLAAQGVQLPLHLSHEEFGVVIDDIGREVFTAETLTARPDRQVISIAALIVVAVNTCGGFKASAEPDGGDHG